MGRKPRPRNLGTPWPLLRFCPSSLLSAFLSRMNPVQIFEAPASPGLGFPVLEAFAAALSPAPRGGPSPTGFFFIYFFPPSYFVRSANSSLCTVPALLSLNLS